MEVTIKLLETAMQAAMTEDRPGEGWKDGRGRFLIDGFPRKMDQAASFDETVCSISQVPDSIYADDPNRSAYRPWSCSSRLQKK